MRMTIVEGARERSGRDGHGGAELSGMTWGWASGGDERLGKPLCDAHSRCGPARHHRPKAPVGGLVWSEGDVVVGLVVEVGVRADVESEVVVDAEELLAGVEVHVKEHGGRLALGHGVAGGEVWMNDVEDGGERVDAGGEGGEDGEGRCSLQVVGGAAVDGHDTCSVASASRTRWRVSASTVLRFLLAASRSAAVARRSMSRRAPPAWSWSRTTVSRVNSSLSHTARRRRVRR